MYETKQQMILFIHRGFQTNQMMWIAIFVVGLENIPGTTEAGLLHLKNLYSVSALFSTLFIISSLSLQVGTTINKIKICNVYGQIFFRHLYQVTLHMKHIKKTVTIFLKPFYFYENIINKTGPPQVSKDTDLKYKVGMKGGRKYCIHLLRSPSRKFRLARGHEKVKKKLSCVYVLCLGCEMVYSSYVQMHLHFCQSNCSFVHSVNSY